MQYEIKPLFDCKKVSITSDFGGKIIDVPMPDVKGELPTRTIDAPSPIDAIKQYWKSLSVESRPTKIQVTTLSNNKVRTYFVDWAGWNECGCGITGWFVMRNEAEYSRMRDNHGNALFELPNRRLIATE